MSVSLTAAVRQPLEFLPIGLFGSVMGLAGLSVAWGLAERRYSLPPWFSELVGALAVIVFVLLIGS